MSKYEQESAAPIHKIRITLSSLNVPSLEKGEFMYIYLKWQCPLAIQYAVSLTFI